MICTEGVFLRRLQEDPLLETTAAVVFDEFHERSLDSDLALAMTRHVQQQVRDDLRIVVMSATLDSAPIAAYLGDCPIVESKGRIFPVEIEYLRFPPNDSIDKIAADGIKQIVSGADGHILVFLPGIGEIRQTESNLETSGVAQDFSVMPLYGEMPLDEQQLVLRPSKKPKLILATNIAETSLTIEGVSTVVDSGWARVNKFDPQAGLNRLELARISRASAAQRAGRAGRTAPGKCLRLWTEREQNSLTELDVPAILRLDLSECLLRLMDWGEKDALSFAWFEPPPADSVERAMALLDKLDAVAAGNITELGRLMVRFPLQPRLSALLLEGARLGAPARASLCAALLSERSPFKRNEIVGEVKHHSDSDVLDRVEALEMFEKNGTRHSMVGELMHGPSKQIVQAADQLLRAMQGISPAVKSENDESILRALAVAFPDRICKRRQSKEPRGVMVGGRGVKLANESAVYQGELFVAVEVADIGSAELLVRQASRVERGWLPQSHINTAIEVSYDSSKERVVAMKRTRFCDLILDESTAAIPADVDPGAVLVEAIEKNVDVSTLIDEEANNYLARLEFLKASLPELGLPELGENPWHDLLPVVCYGLASLAEVKGKSMIPAIQSRLSHEQIVAIDADAPERMKLPTGRFAKLQYERGKAPLLAARIQDLFGLRETPRLARGRVPVMLHLLAPNYRVQQITPDLAGFWKNTYPDVKKELKGRYPKHSWPDNPLTPEK